MNLHTLNLYRLRHRALIRCILRCMVAAALLALTCYGAWWSMTNYLEADAKVAEAKMNERAALDLLEGRVQEVWRYGDYAKIVHYERKEEWAKVIK